MGVGLVSSIFEISCHWSADKGLPEGLAKPIKDQNVQILSIVCEKLVNSLAKFDFLGKQCLCKYSTTRYYFPETHVIKGKSLLP